MNLNGRIQRLQQELAPKKIEAILISQPDNLFYLSGCEGLEGYLLITEQKTIMATDFRYVEQAERQSPHCQIWRISGKIADWLPALLGEQKIRRLGFEANHLSFAGYQQMAEIIQNACPQVEMIPLEEVVETLRVIKDPEEIENISRAAQITDAAYAHVERILQAGMTEKALAWEIEKFMRENDSQSVPFELIVAAGPNSALPHARPSEYAIQSGDPIVIDIGSKFKNYGSDLTRTFCIGNPGDTYLKVYDIVLNAQMAVIERLRPGMTGKEADAIARRFIQKAGYGEAFGHGLGHGIGLVTHEKPRLAMTSVDTLTSGMVFTVEPGIYLSGWGGVRIEDDIVIENDQIRVISSARK